MVFFSRVRRSCVTLLSLASPLRDCQHTAVSWTQKTQQLAWQGVCDYQGYPGQAQSLEAPLSKRLKREEISDRESDPENETW